MGEKYGSKGAGIIDIRSMEPAGIKKPQEIIEAQDEFDKNMEVKHASQELLDKLNKKFGTAPSTQEKKSVNE